MTVVHLDENYRIEIDNLNKTLIKRYWSDSQNVCGRMTEAGFHEKIIGYYITVPGAIKSYLEQLQMEELDDKELTITEYIEQIEKINNTALEKEIKRYEAV